MNIEQSWDFGRLVRHSQAAVPGSVRRGRSVGRSVCLSVGRSVGRSVGLSVCRSVGLSVGRDWSGQDQRTEKDRLIVGCTTLSTYVTLSETGASELERIQSTAPLNPCSVLYEVMFRQGDWGGYFCTVHQTLSRLSRLPLLTT